MELPVFEFLIDENDEIDGVKTISLVGHPAMDSKFLVFDDTKPKPKYIFLNKNDKEYKGIVAGLSIIPDKMIYRADAEGEYYGYFSVDTIEKIRNKYHKELMTNNVNIEHNPKDYIQAYLVESYLLDTQDRVDEVKSKGIEDAVLGAWYTAFKIDDKEAFEKALNGEFTGFSVEAFLNRELRAMSAVKNNNKLKEIKNMKKSLVQKFKEKLNKIVESMNFEEALVPELNITLTWGEVGEAVTKTYMDESDVEVVEPVGQGEFVIEDGRTIVTDEASALLEIRDAVEAPVEEEMVEEKSGEKTITYTEVGQPVMIDGEAAPEGDILLDNGVTLVVDASGNLVEIKEVEAPAEEELEDILPVEEAPVEVEVENKPLSEIIDVEKDGDYVVSVHVEDGHVTEAIVEVEQVLMSKFNKTRDEEITKLKAEIEALKIKLSAPIAEPVLKDKEIQGDVKELTVYEKVASRRGLPLV